MGGGGVKEVEGEGEKGGLLHDRLAVNHPPPAPVTGCFETAG